MPRAKKETPGIVSVSKKRGRPAGSTNKPKTVSVKRGRPVGSTNKPKEPTKAKRGRPVGSTNKTAPVIPEVIPSAPVEDAPMGVPIPKKPSRGRPVGSKNTPQPDVPRVTYTLEPIRGFMDIMKEFGADKGFMVYQVSHKSMELKAEDMPAAVQKYKDAYGKLPVRIILHERNEKLLPYLNAQVPNIVVGLVMGGTALWEIKLQAP